MAAFVALQNIHRLYPRLGRLFVDAKLREAIQEKNGKFFCEPTQRDASNR
jgi:hypothetical protein